MTTKAKRGYLPDYDLINADNTLPVHVEEDILLHHLYLWGYITMVKGEGGAWRHALTDAGEAVARASYGSAPERMLEDHHEMLMELLP